MFGDIIILTAPVVVLGAVFVIAAWDDRRWDARARATRRRVNVRPFPQGGPVLPPPLDPHAGRTARRARHGGTR